MPYADPERRKEYNREYQRGYQQGKAANGVCVRCKNPAAPEHKMCVDCLAREKARYPARRETILREGRQRVLVQKYGITEAEYEAMLEAQGGVCGLCRGTTANGNKLAVDHCHTTGRVRGLLCNSCNLGIGMLGDNATALRRAVEYLEAA